MTTEQMVVTLEDREKIKEFYKLFKASPQSVTNDMRKLVSEKNEVFWNIKKDQNISLKEREEAFDFMRMCHEILGRQFKEEWKPNGKPAGQTKSWPSTKEQRIQNCNDFINFCSKTRWEALSPFEQAMVLAQIWGNVKD